MPEPTPGLTTQNFRVQSQEQEIKDEDVTHEHNLGGTGGHPRRPHARVCHQPRW
jgi:hypothetical protein